MRECISHTHHVFNGLLKLNEKSSHNAYLCCNNNDLQRSDLEPLKTPLNRLFVFFLKNKTVMTMFFDNVT